MNDTDPWVFLPEREPVPEPPPETAGQIIRWWERRRLWFSIAVVLSALSAELIGAMIYPTYLKRTGKLPEWSLLWLFAVFTPAYWLIVGNVVYALGWISELAARFLFRDRARRFGPIVYTTLVVASVIFLIAPGLYMAFIVLSGRPIELLGHQ